MALQVELRIKPDTVMNAFCYDYCKALLEELERLMINDCAQLKGENTLELDNFGYAVMVNLGDQTHIANPTTFNVVDIKNFAEDVRRFLAIFEKKEKAANEKWPPAVSCNPVL